MTYLPDEERFYNMFKITRKDLCYMLDNAESEKEREAIILKKIYGAKETLNGRRGVWTLAKSFEYLRKLEYKKEKVDDFMSKYGDAFGMTGSQVRK